VWSNFPHAIFILRYGTIKNENAGVYMIKMVVICFILLQVDIVLSSLLMILMAYIGKKIQEKKAEEKKEAKKKYTSRLDKVHKEKTFDFVSGWF